MLGLDIIGLGLDVVGSKYTDIEKAGDGATITAGSRVKFVKTKHGLFSYQMPEPPDGSTGVVTNKGFHEFDKTMWADVLLDTDPRNEAEKSFQREPIFTIRTSDLRSLNAPAASAQRTAPTPAATTIDAKDSAAMDALKVLVVLGLGAALLYHLREKRRYNYGERGVTYYEGEVVRPVPVEWK